MTECNAIAILMTEGCFIKMQKVTDYKKVEIKTYKQVIEKFIYLSFTIRLDILFAVSQLSKYNVNPRVGYIKVAKKFVCYL